MTQRNVVAVFGAGASMAAGGIGLSDILPRAFAPRGRVGRPAGKATIREFLHDVFSVPLDDPIAPEQLPNIGLVLSLVDIAIDRNEGLVSAAGAGEGSKKYWSLGELIDIREKLDGVIIETVLAPYLEQFSFQSQIQEIEAGTAAQYFIHEIFLDYLQEKHGAFKLISMNYDMFIERAAMQHLRWVASKEYDGNIVSPNYDVDFGSPYSESLTRCVVHKLHGSLDWVHCTGCGKIDLLYTTEYADHRDDYEATDGALCDDGERIDLQRFGRKLLRQGAAECKDCGSYRRPVIVAPTLVKHYTNDHIRHVWSHAERSLRACEEIYFIGYSLPVEDIDFVAMLKRNTQNLRRRHIHVITPDRAAIDRYKSVFGPTIDVHQQTFQEWVEENQKKISTYPLYRRYRATLQALREGMTLDTILAEEHPARETAN